MSSNRDQKPYVTITTTTCIPATSCLCEGCAFQIQQFRSPDSLLGKQEPNTQLQESFQESLQETRLRHDFQQISLHGSH